MHHELLPVHGAHLHLVTRGELGALDVILDLGRGLLHVLRDDAGDRWEGRVQLDGLARAAGTDLAARLTLLPAGEASQAALPTGPWHAVYLDPMFPTRAKSAAVKQDLQWLQILCAYPDAEEEAALLALARARNTHRVVVKRPRKAPPLAGVAPHHGHEGKTVRFDVYMPLSPA